MSTIATLDVVLRGNTATLRKDLVRSQRQAE